MKGKMPFTEFGLHHDLQRILAVGVAANLALLGWYKYAGFFAAINCAEPAKTMSDISTALSGEMPTAAASTPKANPMGR